MKEEINCGVRHGIPLCVCASVTMCFAASVLPAPQRSRGAITTGDRRSGVRLAGLQFLQVTAQLRGLRWV